MIVVYIVEYLLHSCIHDILYPMQQVACLFGVNYVMITSEGLQILTYAWHSWPFSSEGSLACHTYCDTGHLFIMVISEYL